MRPDSSASHGPRRLTVAAAAVLLACARALGVDGSVLVTDGLEFSAGPVYRVDLPGMGETLIDSDDCIGPTFSPDGNKIAYIKSGRVYICDRDGTERVDANITVSTSGQAIDLNWRRVDTLFWSESTNKLYEAAISTGVKTVVYTSPVAARKFLQADVDASGDRAAATKVPDGIWECMKIDIAGDAEASFGEGCQGSMSPDGTLTTHNLNGHWNANIHYWDSMAVWKVISAPTGTGSGPFDQHRWSTNSNDWILYTCGGNNAWIHNIQTDEQVWVRSGAAWDFYFGAPTAPEPALALSESSLAFSAIEGDPNPGDQTVTVSNVGSGTLSDVMVDENVSWLTVSASGSGNSQTLVNEVDITGLAAGGYQVTVTVSGGGASNAPTYDVDLTISAPPSGPNTPPAVYAGPDYVATLSETVYLDGTVSDDGLPAAPGSTSSSWTKLLGPGDASFGDAGAVDTTVSFTAVGEYVLRLTADDGALQSHDDIAITVGPDPRVTVIAPNGGEELYGGCTYAIQWETEGFVVAVYISYSLNGGTDWTSLTESVQTTDTSWKCYSWTIPAGSSTNCLVLIGGYGGSAPPDSSDASFTINALSDGDGDDMDDTWEVTEFGDASVSDGTPDDDGDGLTDREEFLALTDPSSADTDLDGMSDGAEVACGLNPTIDDAAADPDGDGYANLEELDAGSDPRNAASTPATVGESSAGLSCAPGSACAALAKIALAVIAAAHIRRRRLARQVPSSRT